jgi:hypothetical protein
VINLMLSPPLQFYTEEKISTDVIANWFPYPFSLCMTSSHRTPSAIDLGFVSLFCYPFVSVFSLCLHELWLQELWGGW